VLKVMSGLPSLPFSLFASHHNAIPELMWPTKHGWNSSKPRASEAPVAHAYHPSYLGGRDQEDHGLKPAGVNSS
jgi:hypothetical protein